MPISTSPTSCNKGKERFDRVILDKKIESRERYMKGLLKLLRPAQAAAPRKRRPVPPEKAAPPRTRAARRSRDRGLQKGLHTPSKALHHASITSRRSSRNSAIAGQGSTCTNFWPYEAASLAADPEDAEAPSCAKSNALECRTWLSAADFDAAYNEMLATGCKRSAQGQDRDGRGQPAPRHLHRQEIHQPRPLLPRPDPGRQHGPDEGGREIRIPPRLQVLHLRHLVDPPGHHPLHRRPGPHHPHPGPHDRDDQQADARAEAARPGIRPRADPGGNRRGNAPARRARPRRAQDGPAADLAAGARSATATTPTSATSSRTRPPRTRSDDDRLHACSRTRSRTCSTP